MLRLLVPRAVSLATMACLASLCLLPSACAPLPSGFRPKPLGQPLYNIVDAPAPEGSVAKVVFAGGGVCVPKLSRRPVRSDQVFDPRCTAFEGDPVSVLIHDELAGRFDSLLVWLGDNVTPAGLISEAESMGSRKKRIQRNAGLAMLKRQVEAAGDPERVLFVPGDADAADRPDEPRGRERLVVQEGQVTLLGAQMAARPAESVTTRDVGLRLRVVSLDSATLMAFVDAARGERILEALDAAVAEAAKDNRLVLLTMHHPVMSFGSYGRGSAWGLPLIRQIRGARRASNHPAYEGYVERIKDRLDRWRRRDAPTRDTVLAVVSGHDASLQVVEVGDQFHIVSGAAGRATRVWDEREGLSRIRYANAQPGFVVVHEEVSGGVRLDVVEAHKSASAPTGVRCTTMPQLPAGTVGCRVASLMLASPSAGTTSPMPEGAGTPKILGLPVETL